MLRGNAFNSTRQIWAQLMDEINSLVDILCVLDNDETKSLDVLTTHVDRIQSAIPSKPTDIWYPKPIHHLLSVSPLNRLEIPLDVLDALMSCGFDINQYYGSGMLKMTCLHLAVENHHYNVVKWLVRRGADCNKYSYGYLGYNYLADGITPIAMLAGQHDAPLDLFVTLKTPENLNGHTKPPLHVAVRHGHTRIALHLIDLGADVNYRAEKSLPLHTAVKHGHTELALSLIKHGASVNQATPGGYLPLYHAVAQGKDAKYFNHELFTQLIPECNMDILKIICKLLCNTKPSDKEKEHTMEVLSSMLHKLVQHLILGGPLSISIKGDISSFEMTLNEHLIMNHTPLKMVYMCSVVVMLLGCDVSFVDSIVPQLPFSTSVTKAEADAIDKLWNTYKQKTGVKKLQALCIQETRLSMSSLTDESFQSLPVPARVHSLLMLHDVSHVLWEAYQMWPKCMPIEELRELSAN